MKPKINPKHLHQGEIILIKTGKKDNFSPIWPLLKSFRNKKIIYLSSDKFPCDLIYSLKKNNICLDNVCLINASGLDDSLECNIVNVYPDDLTKICIILDKEMNDDENEKIIVLDGPIGLLLNNDFELVRKFLFDIIKKVKKNRRVILIMVNYIQRGVSETFEDINLFVDKLYEC